MGVLACDRTGCRNIMCDRLILNHTMYICNTCFEELKLFKATWRPPMTGAAIEVAIRDFMHTPPQTYGDKNVEEIEADFHRLTGETGDP